MRIPRNSEAIRCVQGRQQSFSQASCRMAIRETGPAGVEACGSTSPPGKHFRHRCQCDVLALWMEVASEGAVGDGPEGQLRPVDS